MTGLRPTLAMFNAFGRLLRHLVPGSSTGAQRPLTASPSPSPAWTRDESVGSQRSCVAPLSLKVACKGQLRDVERWPVPSRLDLRWVCAGGSLFQASNGSGKRSRWEGSCGAEHTVIYLLLQGGHVSAQGLATLSCVSRSFRSVCTGTCHAKTGKQVTPVHSGAPDSCPDLRSMCLSPHFSEASCLEHRPGWLLPVCGHGGGRRARTSRCGTWPPRLSGPP